MSATTETTRRLQESALEPDADAARDGGPPAATGMAPAFRRILYLVGEDTYGGLEDYIREVARGAAGTGSTVTVCQASRPGERPRLPERLRRSGLSVGEIVLDSRLVAGLFRNLRGLWRLGRMLQDGNVDLLHIHLSPFHVYFLAILLARLLQVPRVVLHLVGVEPPRQRRERWLDPLLARMVDRVVVITRALRRQVRAAGFRTRRFSVIYMGEDLGRLDPAKVDGQKVRTELGIGDDTLVVGVVARLHPLKGQETLLRAAARVLDRTAEVRFLLIGTGDDGYRRRLEGLAAQLGIAAKVDFLGHRDDIPAVTAALDVAVLASENEAMGHCLLEAMALGKPVIATRVGGIPEVVLDGETGYLVRPGDDGTLAAHLLRLLGNPAERRILGEKGRRWVVGRFRLEDSVRRTLHFYEDLAGGRAKRVYQESEA